MKVVTLVGGLLLAVGIVGVIWGVIKMYDDRNTIEIGDDATIVLDDGDFPLVGIAGVVVGAAGLVVTIAGATTGRKSS